MSEKGTYSLVHSKHVFCFSFALLDNIIHSKNLQKKQSKQTHFKKNPKAF